MTVFGYARVLYERQSVSPQVRSLKAAGCTKIIAEVSPRKLQYQPRLRELIDELSAEDEILVLSVDRLANSPQHLEILLREIEEKGAIFKSIKDKINMAGARSKVTADALMVAEKFERRIKLDEAKENALELKRAAGIKKQTTNELSGRELKVLRRDFYRGVVFDERNRWIYYIKKLRPNLPWSDVTHIINTVEVRGRPWTKERLQLAARHCVRHGYLPKEIFGRAWPLDTKSRLYLIISAIKDEETNIDVEAICQTLQILGEHQPDEITILGVEDIKKFIE